MEIFMGIFEYKFYMVQRYNVTDIRNKAHVCFLQGVLVFVVLVCKKKTVKRVASRISRGSRFESTYTTRYFNIDNRQLAKVQSDELCMIEIADRYI